MAARRRTIDPATGDYVLEGGRIVDDSSHTSQVMLALRHRKGSSPVFPAFGSEFHLIRTLDPRAPRRAKHTAVAAVAHLVRRKAIQKLNVTAAVEGNALPVDVEFVDQDGIPRHAPYTHKVG